MLVDGAEAGEELGEVVGADGDHQRQPDRRVDRVAAADPFPEPEHVVRVDAEVGDLGRVGAHGDEVLGDGVLTERRDEPGPRRAGVGQRLDRREGLRGDDEQRLGRIEVGERHAAMAAPSTLETNRHVSPGWANARSAR